MGIVTELSDFFQVSEEAMKLIITVYAGYIYALIHRSFLFKASSSLQLFYLCLTGWLMLYWSYGFDLLHSLLCVVVQYLIFAIFGASIFSTALSFAFQLGYLLYAYWLFSPITYEVMWHVPHCILTMRLIGLAFDVYDGHKNEKYLSKEQNESCIKDIPSLFEIMGFSYMYCGFLVGPQFSLRRFRALLKGELTDNPGKKPNSLLPGLQCFIAGTLVLVVHIYLSSNFYTDYYLTSQFQNSSFPYKFSYINITYMSNLLQYIAVWMINDGSCVICGLGFRKDEKTGKVYWDAVASAKLCNFLFMQSFAGLTSSFNITTNKWVFNYIYKRLKFVGVREVSQFCALAFLAVWHGFHEGYYTAFFFQFFVTFLKDPVLDEVSSWKVVKIMQGSPYLNWIPRLIAPLVIHSLIAYGLTDFFLKKWHRYYPVHVATHFYGYVFTITCYTVVKLKSQLIPPTKKPASKEE